MGERAIRSVAIRTVAMVVVFAVGFFVIRLAQIVEEDRGYAELHARLDAAQRLPTSPPVRASVEDCAMFRKIARDHYHAHDMPVVEKAPRGWLLEDARHYGAGVRMPGLTGPQARSIARASWRVTGDYVIDCDWRGSGLLADGDPPASGGKPVACPPAASVANRREPGMISPNPDARWEPRVYPCRSRPADQAPPHIFFLRPLRSDDGRRAVVSTHYWYGNLGAKGYRCLFKRRGKAWVFDHCRFTWIS